MPSEEWKEEVEVIESIFGKEAVCYDNENDELSIQCQISLQTKSITVYSTINLAQGNNEGVRGADEIIEQNLNYLAPVLLLCKPSDNYPSQANLALLSVNCVWLSKGELESVENHLKSLWTAGDPVIYDMVTWIQDNLLEYLDIYDEIHFPGSSDEYCCDALTRISILNQSNRENTMKLFNSQSHDCGTCFCEFSGEDLCLLSCLHYYCKECISTLINVQFNSGRYCKINCPSCDSFLGREIIEQFLDSDSFHLWEERFLMQSVEENSMILFCPRCDNYAVSEEDNLGSCVSCNYLFCDLCNNAWHPGRCESFEQGERQVTSSQDPNVKRMEAKRSKEAHRKNEKLTLLMKHSFLKRCPKCKCWVMRESGCNHMHCALCGTDFCYVCGRAGAYCCGAFVPTAPQNIEVLNKEQKLYVKDVVPISEPVENVIELDAGDNNITKCPKCKSRIQRMNGNNHGKCAVCKNQFCFLCLSLIKGTGHFTLRGCQQHGGDVKR